MPLWRYTNEQLLTAVRQLEKRSVLQISRTSGLYVNYEVQCEDGTHWLSFPEYQIRAIIHELPSDR